MLIKVFILVCNLSVPIQDCNRGTATDIIKGPDSDSLQTCQFQGQSYLAETELGDALKEKSLYIKVLCQFGMKKQEEAIK